MLVLLFSQGSNQSVSIVWFLNPVLYFGCTGGLEGLSLRELGFASTSEEKGIEHVAGHIHIHAPILLLSPLSSTSLSTNSSEKQGTGVKGSPG